MARLYLQVEIDVREHPKVLAIVDELQLPSDIGPDLVVGFLERWWGYCARFGSNGTSADCPQSLLTEYARRMIGRSANPVTPDLVQLLRKHRLMDQYGRPWDWQVYTGNLLARRAKDAERHRNLYRDSAENPQRLRRREEKSSSGSNTGSTEAGNQKGDRRSKSKVTWLTPFWDAWVAAYGGDPNAGVLSKEISRLREKHPDSEVEAAWKNYLSQTEAEFASPPRFAQTYGKWSGTAQLPLGKMTRQERNLAAIDEGVRRLEEMEHGDH